MPSAPNEIQSIYRYDDYRGYLRDRFCARCLEDQSFSHRKFAREAGFSNPGFLNDVIKGRRKLSKAAVEKMIRGFGLSSSEADFFRLLVAYAQARTDEQKDALYRRIQTRRNRSAFARIHPAQSRYYQDTAYALIRSALMIVDFRGDYERLSRFLHPPLSVQTVKKCIRDLCDWGLVEQDAQGRYRPTSAFVEPPSTMREQVKQMNRQWIVDAVEGLASLPASRRAMSTMLLSVSSECARKINDRIESVREEIWRMVQEDERDPAVLMQLNVQYFPRSRKESS
jgi:uncharacterized protein (TIGR02147 family)